MKHNFSPAEREYYSAPQLLSEPRARICYPTMSGHMANPSGWYLRSEVWQTDQLSCEILLFLFLFFFQSRIISMQPSSVFYCISILLLFFLGIDYCSNRHKKKSSALHQYQPLFPISLKFCCLSSHLCMLSEKKKKKKHFPHSKLESPAALSRPLRSSHHGLPDYPQKKKNSLLIRLSERDGLPECTRLVLSCI